MQSTSALYKTILSGSHAKEVKLDVYSSDGTTLIHSFGMDRLISMESSCSLLSNGGFSVGSCVSGKLNVSMFPTDANERNINIPKMAMLVPKIRLVSSSGTVSEWLQKGVYFIDTRSVDNLTGIMSIEAYDAMLKTEADFDTTLSATYPISDISAVNIIAGQIGVSVDQRTENVIDENYQISMPTGYSCREVLSGIGAAYGASFCISDDGELLAISLTNVPIPTRVLLDESKQYAITVGGVRILV